MQLRGSGQPFPAAPDEAWHWVPAPTQLPLPLRDTACHTTGRTIGGMADKVTLSLNPDTLARARTAAERTGMTLSAWMDRAARREALRDAGRRYEEWLDANPEAREEVTAWRGMTSGVTSRRWATLTEGDA